MVDLPVFTSVRVIKRIVVSYTVLLRSLDCCLHRQISVGVPKAEHIQNIN